jgi:nicotinate-nucleotide pyrophosphorylase (carboxylating)
MNARAQVQARPARPEREAQLKRALFRGDDLHVGNPKYLAAVATLMEELLLSDIGPGDLTVKALGLGKGRSNARVVAKEAGVAAGVEEYQWLLHLSGITVKLLKKDGDPIECDEALLEIEGQRGDLLSHERTGLNLLQRMSGIATMTRRLQERVQRRNPGTFVVATRKTPWGLLDKRAVHLGGGGTHRLGLSDAVLIKNNHLALLAAREDEAIRVAVERAWGSRAAAAFIEVEVRSAEAAVAAAQTFRRLQEQDSTSCPCLLLLDNMAPGQVRRTLDALLSKEVREHVLIEVSGNISESNIEEYASCGADALSLGALTHSPRALDLSLRIP